MFNPLLASILADTKDKQVAKKLIVICGRTVQNR